MNFIIGYTVRPKNINRLNQVIYEEYDLEGTLVEVLPTLDECEAYGFVFNNSDSKCYIANNPLVFNNPSATQNLSIARASNTIGRNTRDNLIAGASHILTSNNYSNVISGENNTVTDLVSNTTISGTKGEATADNSNVIGGNSVLAGTSPLGNELIQNGDFSELGAELITNGDFATDTDWSKQTGWTISGGTANFIGVGSGNRNIYQTIMTVGVTYELKYDVLNFVSGGIRNVSRSGAISRNANGTYTEIFVATYTTLYLKCDVLSELSIDNVSVKEVGVNWSKDANWTIANDVATSSGYGRMFQSIAFLEANRANVKITFEIKQLTNGGVVVNCYGLISQLFNTIGVHTFSGVTTNNTNLYFNNSGAGSNFIGSIDNVSVVEQLPYIAPKQSIQLLYGLQSTDGSNKSSFLNGITDSLFAIPENSVMYFHADVIAVRVGGVHATGAVGDYGSWVERGVIINKSGVLSINRERDTIKSSGSVTNWQPTGIVDGTNFAMRVRGHADMTIEWASNITFTEIKTGVAL